MIRDPRTKRFFARKEPLDLPVPRFRIDNNYVGDPPPLEITITNLNDNINKPFLNELASKHGPVEDCCIFYHPKTKKHLGIARVTFLETKSAKSCIDKLHNSSVMGNIIVVFFDAFGKEAEKLVENLVNPSQPTPKLPTNDRNAQSQSLVHSEFQPFIPQKETKSMTNFPLPNQQQQTMFEQISQLKIENNFDSYSTSSYYQQHQGNWTNQGELNKTNSNSAYNSFQYNQLNNSPLKQLQQQQSKERESLDSRIEHLFKKQGFGNSFLGELRGLTNLSPSFESTSKHKQENDYQRNHKSSSRESFHASFHSEQILGTPPSPFLSSSDYIKSHKLTKAIDEGRNPSFTDEEESNISDNDDYGFEDEPFEDSMTNDKQCTPRQRSYLRNRYNNQKKINNSSTNKYDEIDDDRMSLSSLSSGDKLELPDDLERVSFSHKGFKPFTINSNDTVLKRNKSNSNSYWNKSSSTNNSIDTIKINNTNQSFKFQISTTSSNLNNLSFFDTKHQRSKHSHKFNDVFDSYDDHHKPIVEDKNKLIRTRLANLKQGVLKIVVAELKGIIEKDINKKIIESTAFKIYENWWDESEKQFKQRKEQKENQENLNNTGITSSIGDKSTANKSSIYPKEDPTAWPSVLSAVTYNKSTNNSNPFLTEGYQYGHLRAAIPKMPSFKRKVKSTRNEDNQRSGYYKKNSFSDDELEKISSDDETFPTVNDKKYAKAKNRSAAIIDNDLESLSSDEDSSSRSISKFRDHKRKQKKKRHKNSLSGSNSSLSSSSSSSFSSTTSSSSSADSSSTETDNNSSENDESGSESDRSNASKRSNISSEMSSLESYDRKPIKPLTRTFSKSSLLSSISKSSSTLKSINSYESASSTYESEDETKAVIKEESLKDEPVIEKGEKPIKSSKNEKQQSIQDLEMEIEKQLEEAEEAQTPSEVPISEKPIKRKVGRPPKANKQQKNVTAKEDKTKGKSNEKENVKPLKQRQEMFNEERNENELMTREEIEASEALMALSGFFSSKQPSQSTDSATDLPTIVSSLPQPKTVIVLSEQMTIQPHSTTVLETYSDVETDSASESEFMKTIFETPEESVAIDHAYCKLDKDQLRLRTKYSKNDFSSVFDDDDMTDLKYSDHMYNKILANKQQRGKKKQAQQAETKKGV